MAADSFKLSDDTGTTCSAAAPTYAALLRISRPVASLLRGAKPDGHGGLGTTGQRLGSSDCGVGARSPGRNHSVAIQLWRFAAASCLSRKISSSIVIRATAAISIAPIWDVALRRSQAGVAWKSVEPVDQAGSIAAAITGQARATFPQTTQCHLPAKLPLNVVRWT
jgi:hypothetical protein